MPAEVNSNDFGPFCIQFVEFESNFVVAGINNFERFEFLVCLLLLCCVLWPVFTRGQTHSTDTAQHRDTQHSQIIVLFFYCGCVLDDSWPYVYVFSVILKAV